MSVINDKGSYEFTLDEWTRENYQIQTTMHGVQNQNPYGSLEERIVTKLNDDIDWELLMNKIKQASAEVGLELNLSKRKVMTTGKNQIFKIDGRVLEIVECYIFLGSIVTKDGMCTKEIKRRIMMGKSAMSKLERTLKDKNVTKQTKITIAQTLVFPIVMNGSESWTMRKKDIKKTLCF